MTSSEQKRDRAMRILLMARQAREDGDLVTAELLTEEAMQDTEEAMDDLDTERDSIRPRLQGRDSS
jgi:bacterioferritin (cytochrome b1)